MEKMDIELIIEIKDPLDAPLLYIVKAKIVEYVNKIPQVSIRCNYNKKEVE